MGGIAMRKPDDIAAWFRRELSMDRDGVVSRALDVAMVDRAELYAAVETVRDGERQVWAAVFKIGFRPNDPDGYTFSYRDMDETVGPVEARCPARILDLLTPTDHERANGWRERCRARLERRAANSLADGDVVRLPYEMSFTDGESFDLVEATTVGRRMRFRRVDPETGEAGRGHYRIAGWRDMALERVDRATLGPAAPRP
jgi:hypothetical protein